MNSYLLMNHNQLVFMSYFIYLYIISALYYVQLVNSSGINIATVSYFGYFKVCFITDHCKLAPSKSHFISYNCSGFREQPSIIAPCPFGDVTIEPSTHCVGISGPEIKYQNKNTCFGGDFISYINITREPSSIKIINIKQFCC